MEIRGTIDIRSRTSGARDMSLTNVEWTELKLEPDDTAFRSGHAATKGVIAFGTPVTFDALALTKQANAEPDAEIQLMAREFSFTYVRLALSIRPGDDYTVRFVSMDLDLGPDGVCWSMEPLKVEQQIKSRTESKVSSGLKLKLASLGSEIKDSDEFVVYQPTIEAFNLMRPDPAWELRAAPGRALSGTLLFHMIIRLPKRSSSVARISMRADVSQRGMLWNYRVRRPDNSEEIASIRLGPPA
jgi:hypothetical protein